MVSFKFCLIFAIVGFVASSHSPCPGVFEYSFDNAMNLFGVIVSPIPNNFGSAIVLDVEFTVGNAVKGFIGKIHLMGSSEATIQNIIQNKPISFRLEFPEWRGIKPQVTKILVNRIQICTGSPIPQGSGAPVITTINLKYTLNVSIPSRPSNSFGIPGNNGINNNNVVFTQLPQQVNTNNNNKPPSTSFNIPNFVDQTHVPNLSGNPNNFIPVQNGINNQFLTNNINNNQSPLQIPSNNHQNPFIPAQITPDIPTKIGAPTPTQPGSSLSSLQNVCGLVDNSSPFIVGGEDARKSDYPWLGALFKQTSTAGTFICGATLFTKTHALTAAHCVHGVRPGRLHLILGREDINQWLSDGLQVQVIDTHVHENYIPRQGDADIAILKLSKEVKFTAFIRPICLWNDEISLNSIVGSTGVVVGWGKDDSGNSSSTPKRATLPIASDEECLRSHSAYALLTSNRTFCAGYRNDSGPCSGDSGSGFYLERNNRWFLRGIVSLGLLANQTCDLQNFVVFVDTAKFQDWILSYITG